MYMHAHEYTHTKVYLKLYCKTSFLLLLNSHCDKIQAFDELHSEKDQRLKMGLHLPISFPFFIT